MSRVHELVDWLGSARYLTTLDLAKGYWQVPMAEGIVCFTKTSTFNFAL